MDQITTAQQGLSVAAAADRAGVDATALRDAISRGEVEAHRVLVVQPAEVDRWADTHKGDA